MNVEQASAAEAQRGKHLRLRWPRSGHNCASDNFFVGAFDPSVPLTIGIDGELATDVAVQRGANWWLASAVAPGSQFPLIHAHPTGGAVAFRGYVLPDLQCYAPSSAILRHWIDEPRSAPDGVFAAAVIMQAGNSLALVTDLLGIGALYWRQFGTTTLFATNPRFLSCPGDQVDELAWRSLVQASWIISDRSLCLDVRRVPAGQSIHVTAGGVTFGRSRLDSLPGGERHLDRTALGEIEEVFQQAIDRCLRLSPGDLMLPLSSGFDSRRILAGLVSRGSSFVATTCRLIQSERMDLDARFASAMARDFGFQHAVVEADVHSYVADDLTRRVLLDGESLEHSWAIPVVQRPPTSYSAMMDGLAGDVLGDPVGWTEQLGVSPRSGDVAHEIEDVIGHAVGPEYDSVLASDRWCGADAVREDLRHYLRPLAERRNGSELSFLLLRQRRAVAVWSQQLTPPGVLPLYPYLDPDYLALLLSLGSSDKHRTDVQRSCLRRFWPQYYGYPGTRDVPSHLLPSEVETELAGSAAAQRQLRREIATAGWQEELRRRLTPKGVIALQASKYSPALAKRWGWFLRPVLELVSWHASREPVWRWVN